MPSDVDVLGRPSAGSVFLAEAEPIAGCVGFAVRRFRPVQTRKTDISIFTAMLHDVKRPEPVMLSTPWGKVPA